MGFYDEWIEISLFLVDTRACLLLGVFLFFGLRACEVGWDGVE
jgi:hypothetical protein